MIINYSTNRGIMQTKIISNFFQSTAGYCKLPIGVIQAFISLLNGVFIQIPEDIQGSLIWVVANNSNDALRSSPLSSAYLIALKLTNGWIKQKLLSLPIGV